MTKASFTTRPAVTDDVDILYQLICELAVYEKKNADILPVTKENLLKYGFGEAPCFHVELAENQNGVVGYALFSYGFSGHQGRPFLYLDDLYVRSAERGRGIGTALLQRVAKYAKDMDCCFMQWLAFDWNEKAIAFYEHLGGTKRADFRLIRMGKEAYIDVARKAHCSQS